jgi:hypothetical protein
MRATPPSIGMTEDTRKQTTAVSVCDGYGCYSRAKCNLIIKVGPKKTISLSLCEDCRTKFNNRSRTDVTVKQQKSEIVSVD